MGIYKKQETYWDVAADKKEFTTPFQLDLFTSHVSKDNTILDVGCGYGRTLNELYDCGYRNLSGIDFSQQMIEKGKRLFPDLSLLKIDNNAFPNADGSVDAVILVAVLTCIIDDNEQDALINEIKRVLKPSGFLYINDFLINEDDRNIERYQAFEKKYGCYGIFELPEGAVLRHYSEERISELTHSFHTLSHKKTVYTTMNGNRSNGFYFIGKK